MNYGQKVKDIRKRNGKSATDLAKYLNVSPQMVSQVERGFTHFSSDNTLKIAIWFKIPVDYFYNENYGSFNSMEQDNVARLMLEDDSLIDYIIIASEAKKDGITVAELKEAMYFIKQLKNSRMQTAL